MTIVLIKGVPLDWCASKLRNSLNKAAFKLQGHFKVLGFDKPRGNNKWGFVEVSDMYEPHRAVQLVNSALGIHLSQGIKLHASFTNRVPDTLTTNSIKKYGTKKPYQNNKKNPNRRPNQSKKQRQERYATKTKKGKAAATPEQILEQTHREFLDEIQRKYRGLPDLSKKTDDKLLDVIALTLFQRLKNIMDTWKQKTGDSFGVTKAYRDRYPHTTDFQLIQSVLNKIEDVKGVPRTTLSEAELLTETATPYVKESWDMLNKIATRFSVNIENKVAAYVAGLQAAAGAEAGDGGAGRRRVARELVNMGYALNQIIRHVIGNNFPNIVSKTGAPCHLIRIYGEPYLPGREVLEPQLSKYKPLRVIRSQRLYNSVSVTVPINQYPAVMALDGLSLAGAKLVVRPTEKLEYKIKPTLLCKILAAFGAHTQAQAGPAQAKAGPAQAKAGPALAQAGPAQAQAGPAQAQAGPAQQMAGPASQEISNPVLPADVKPVITGLSNTVPETPLDSQGIAIKSEIV